MKTLILIMAFTMFLGCDSEGGEEQFVYDVAFEFDIKDSEGNDMLNPENPNSFDESAIKLFYLIEGNVTEVYDGNMDYPRNFRIYEYPPASAYRIVIFLNHSETEEFPITYIKWNETDTDTISSEIYRTSSLVKIQKVWLNDEPIWNSSSNSEPYFELIK